jgi:predicted  nucleic acid-binding Zn-ribbon protein
MSDFRERIASARERLHATSADQAELRILREEVARLTEALDSMTDRLWRERDRHKARTASLEDTP